MPRRRRVNRASLRALHQSLEQALAQPEEEEEDDDDEADGEEEEDEEEEEEESGLGQRGLAVNTAFLGRLLGSLSRTNTRVERGIAEGAVANERRANLAARRRDGEARIRRIAAACRLRVEVYPLDDDDGGAAAAPAPAAAAAPGDLRARLTAAKPPAIDVAAAAAGGAAASTQRVSPRNRRPPAAAYVPPGRRGAAPAAAAPAVAAPAAAPPIGVAARLGKRPAEAAAPVSDLRAKLSRPAAS